MMRARILVLVLVTLVATALHAETYVFEGTLSVQASGVPAIADTQIGVATVNSSGGGANITSLALPSGLFSISSTVVPTGTGLPLTAVEFTVMMNGGTLVAATPTAPLLGPVAVPGNVRICVLFNCAFNVDVPLTENGTRGVGLGGPPITVMGLASISAQGATWGDQVAVITTTTPTSSSTSMVSAAGFAHGPASNTGTTADASGVLQLVTPVAIVATTTGTAIPTFGVMNLRFLPEPGMLVLFGSGALALALLGARRR